MATTTIQIDRAKIFPELHIQTSAQTSLAAGSTDLFDLKKINGKNQCVKILKEGFDAVDNVFTVGKVDNGGGMITGNQTHTNSGIGIAKYNDVFGDHQIDVAFKEYIYSAINNSGGASSNFRSALVYVVDAADAMTKLQQGIPLSSRDTEAIKILQAHPEKVPDPVLAAKLGIGVPKTFNDFLTIHEVKKVNKYSSGQAQTLNTTGFNLVNDVPINIGKEALVLERIQIQRPVQANINTVNVNIFRDNEPTALMTLDPACFEAIPSSSEGGTVNSLATVNLHVHAFERLQIQCIAVTGSISNFKATAYCSVRNIGVGFKAKMEEFLGSQLFPSVIDISSAEREIMDNMYLKELSRAGLTNIG